MQLENIRFKMHIGNLIVKVRLYSTYDVDGAVRFAAMFGGELFFMNKVDGYAETNLSHKVYVLL